MSHPTLISCIAQSLRLGQMVPDLAMALLEPPRNKVRNRTENRHWDYKRELLFNDPFQRAEFARDVAAFHNTDGGFIAVGVTDDYAVRGVSQAVILDTKQLREKLLGFLGPSVQIFQDAVEVPGNRYVWLIFIQKYVDVPHAMERDGPHRSGKPVFNKGQYFYRDGDEVKLCRSEGDKERIFRGFRGEHLSAYTYEIDEPYFRLLDPNCEKFVGRREKIDEIKAKMNLRHHVIALDGLGGVGKTAVAITGSTRVIRRARQILLYRFVICQIESVAWTYHAKARCVRGSAGLTDRDSRCLS